MYGVDTSGLAPEKIYHLMGRCCTRGGLYRLIMPHPKASTEAPDLWLQETSEACLAPHSFFTSPSRFGGVCDACYQGKAASSPDVAARRRCHGQCKAVELQDQAKTGLDPTPDTSRGALSMSSPCCRQLNVHEHGIGSLTLHSAPRARLALVTLLLSLTSQQGESMMLCCTTVDVFHALEKDFIFALQR